VYIDLFHPPLPLTAPCYEGTQLWDFSTVRGASLNCLLATIKCIFSQHCHSWWWMRRSTTSTLQLETHYWKFITSTPSSEPWEEKCSHLKNLVITLEIPGSYHGRTYTHKADGKLSKLDQR